MGLRQPWPLLSPCSTVTVKCLWLMMAVQSVTHPRLSSGTERPDPIEPQIAEASTEGQTALSSFKRPSHWRMELYAAEPSVANPVAFTVDHRGRIWVCESFRQNQGVTDNRGHDQEWLLADLSSQSVEDRIAYHRRLLGVEAANYEKQIDRLRVLIDRDHDHQADESISFVSGFHGLEEGTGAGVLVRHGKVFYTCIPRLWLFQDDDDDLRPDRQQALHDGFGVRVAFRGHDMHGLILGPDGRLYFSIGDRGYRVHSKEGKLLADPESGAVFRCELDGSSLEVIATGLRNPQELAFDDYGNLFTGDNNSDSGDQARWTVIVPGGDSGWRMMYQYMPDRGPFNREKIWQPYHAETPAYIIPPIANFADGPSGLVAYPGTGLDDSFRGTFFLCDFRGQASNSGVRTAKVKARGASFELVEMAEPIWNILATDIDFGPDGSLFVSDWVNGWNGEGKGRIYRLYDPSQQAQALVEETRRLLYDGMTAREAATLGQLLSHPDRRVRLEAQWELAARDERKLLLAVARDPQAEELGRIHAIWGLGQILRHGSSARDLLRLLLDELGSVGRESLPVEGIVALANVVGDADLSQVEAEEANLLDVFLSTGLASSHPRIQYAAALAVGRLGRESLMPQVIEMLERNADLDPLLRHAGIMALVGQPSLERLAALAVHPSASVRLAAVVALRKRQSDKIAKFLEDDTEAVVMEAVRAIHDLPALHGQLDRIAGLITGGSRSETILRRVLNANFRLGQAEHAVALARFAADPTRASTMRLEALAMLGEWPKPGVYDRVMHRHAPLPARPRIAAAVALEGELTTLLGAENELREKTREVAVELNISAITPALVAVVRDPNRPGVERAKSLEQLWNLRSPEARGLANTLLDDGSPAMRVAALQTLASFDEVAACAAAGRRVHSDVLIERQAAWDLVGKLRCPEAKAIAEEGLELYRQSRVPADCWLNLKEAVLAQLGETAQERLTSVEASLTAQSPEFAIGGYRECVVGGDVLRGQQLFLERAQLSCVRCHRVGKDGGEVGPNLSDIGLKKNREYLLEAILAPNAKVAEGFETVLVQTDEGEVLSGIVKKKEDHQLLIVKADGTEVVVPTASIEAMRPGQSSMPADLVKYLNKRELRDLVAYLASLDGQPSKGNGKDRSSAHGRK
jgi:quinoprotein glucose dehydrogenase